MLSPRPLGERALMVEPRGVPYSLEDEAHGLLPVLALERQGPREHLELQRQSRGRSDPQRRFWKGRAVPGTGCGGAGARPGTPRQAALTMSTPKDHQSALCVWPRRFTTSGAMYSMVPQNE